jgi:LysM repeat protein
VFTIEQTLGLGHCTEHLANIELCWGDTMITATATIDHRTGLTLSGGPASRYHRVVRIDAEGAGRPNYAARRLGALFVALASLMIMFSLFNGLLASFGGAPASAAGAPPAATAVAVVAPTVHVAQPGESLWSIADQHRGSVDRDRYVDALVILNNGTVVYVGQAVRLP